MQIDGFEKVTEREREVLIALRRIIRAIDLSAKSLGRKTGLTTSQLLVLHLLESEGALSAGQLARELRLAKPTVTAVLHALENRNLIERARARKDRRSVVVALTQEGRRSLSEAPTPLQERFLREFNQIAAWEQTFILSALQRVCLMLGANKIDASPVLDVGAIIRTEKPET